MKVLLAKLMKSILSDPKAREEMKNAVQGRRNTVTYNGKTYSVKIGP